MKTAITATLAVALVTSTAFISTASASFDITAEREARSAKIEALYEKYRQTKNKESDKRTLRLLNCNKL